MKEIRCNLCGSGFYRVVYDLNKAQAQSCVPKYKISADKEDLSSLRIVRCLKCGLIYAMPFGDQADIYQRYCNMEDNLYVSEEKGRRSAATVLLKKIARFKDRGRLLDVGCATGFLLDEAKKIGWEPYGIDMSEWAVNFAKEKLSLNVFKGLLKEASFPDNYFDAVVINDVIEHMPDPKEILQEVRRILNPAGVLCISTPDVNSFTSKLLKARWWGIQQAHIYYFSKETLSKMLDAAGFKALKYSSHARFFTLGYLANRLKNYNKHICRICGFAAKHLFSKDKLFRVNLGDQIEVFAKKKRSLAFINSDEKREKTEISLTKMKTTVVMPAYNAAKTLELTIKDIPKDLVDEIILVDDASKDNTSELATNLGLKVFTHPKNRGYGANQKTCYAKALETGADIVVMVHPDYQYDPKAIPRLIEPIVKGEADAVFGSRMMKGGALEGGMPIWKHNANILLTALENVVLGTYLTEYHSGFRAYSAKYLKTVNFMANSDNFVFDTEIIVQGIANYLKIDEVPIKTRYFDEASTIKLIPAVIYGLGILKTLFKYILHKYRIIRFKQFE